MSQEPANIDASVITIPLDEALSALRNKIDREWPPQFGHIVGAREFVLLTVGIADVTSRSIRFLCAEKPPDPNRLIEYCLSAPPLNRTILDNLFTVLFVLEDVPARCCWYYKAAWREERLELIRYQKEYGSLSEWKDWLGRLEAHSEFSIGLFGISAGEVADPSRITRWPNAGAMVNYGLRPTDPKAADRAFMEYLNDWFYKDLSQQAHLGGTGLMKRASILLFDRHDPERERSLVKNKYAWVGQTIALVLALATEIECYFHFGVRERLSYVWGLAAPVIVVVKELYEKRYQDLLAAP